MERQRKILILGASGYVGRRVFEKAGNTAIATYNRTPLEGAVRFDAVMMDLSQIVSSPENISHAVILLGDTVPSSCAADIDKSQEINVNSIIRILDRLKEWGIKPIYASSERVYDGEKGNYSEDDPTEPLLIYGKQKLEVERYITAHFDDYVILRIGKVVGTNPGDGSLFSNWLEKLNTGSRITCAADQAFSPVYREDLAEIILRFCRENHKGVFNVSCDHRYLRMELLRMLIEHVREYEKLDIEIEPCSIEDFRVGAESPSRDVSLKAGKLARQLDFIFTSMPTVCQRIVRHKYEKARHVC